MKEFDTILITGTPTSCTDAYIRNTHIDPDGEFYRYSFEPPTFVNLKATIATIERTNKCTHIKVWADENDPQLSPKQKNDRKMWFILEDCQIKIVDDSEL